jgi:anti-sigma-K factor RskA
MSTEPEITAARNELTRVRDRMTDTAAELEERLTAPIVVVKDKLDVVQLVRENPWPSLAVAIGVGAAVAACAALALGLWGASVSSDLDEARSALARERAAAAILAQPRAEASLTGARGRLVVGDDGKAVLVVSGVPPVPDGKTYQVWVIDDRHPVSGGLFAPAAGTQAIPVDGRVAKGSVVAVTIEDDGGASAPTGKPVIASAPVAVS